MLWDNICFRDTFKKGGIKYTTKITQKRYTLNNTTYLSLVTLFQNINSLQHIFTLLKHKKSLPSAQALHLPPFQFKVCSYLRPL